MSLPVSEPLAGGCALFWARIDECIAQPMLTRYIVSPMLDVSRVLLGRLNSTTVPKLFINAVLMSQSRLRSRSSVTFSASTSPVAVAVALHQSSSSSVVMAF